MARKLDGIDEFRDSQGVLFAPLGFGFSEDWERIARREFSGAGNVDIFWDDDTYDEIEIVAMGITVGTDPRDLRVQFSTDGSTFVTSANYTWARYAVNSSPASSAAAGTNETSFMGILSLGTATDELGTMAMRIFNVSNTSQKKSVEWLHTGRLSDGLINRAMYTGQMNASNGSIRGVRLFGESSATISGLVTVRGRRKTPQALQSQDDWVVIDDQSGILAVTTHDVFWDDQVWDEIEVTISGLSIGTDATAVEMTLSTDGSTFLTGATDYEWNRVLAHSASTNPGTGGSTGDSKIELHHSAGTGTDEEIDIKVTFKNVSNTDKKKRCRIESEGNSDDGLFRVNYGAGMLVANNNSLRGFRIDPAGAVTFSADRIRVRGRRLTPAGAQVGADWEIIEERDITSGVGTIPFTDIPVGEYQLLELSFEGLLTDTSGNGIMLRFSGDNGSTYDSGANYDEVGERYQPTGSTQENAGAQTEIQILNNFGAVSDRGGTGILHFFHMNNANHKYVYGQTMSLDDPDDATFKNIGGVWFGTGANAPVSAFQLHLAAGGNFTAGRLTLRGRRRI